MNFRGWDFFANFESSPRYLWAGRNIEMPAGGAAIQPKPVFLELKVRRFGSADSTPYPILQDTRFLYHGSIQH
jgi:hypothetical protein